MKDSEDNQVKVMPCLDLAISLIDEKVDSFCDDTLETIQARRKRAEQHNRARVTNKYQRLKKKINKKYNEMGRSYDTKEMS